LQFGDLSKRRFNAILDAANLRGDVVNRVLNHLFAHDYSFPDAQWRGVSSGVEGGDLAAEES
jgi:hypothetical protein